MNMYEQVSNDSIKQHCVLTVCWVIYTEEHVFYSM